MSSAICLASSNVRRRHAVLGGGQPGVGEHLAEGAALLGEVDRLGRGADDLHAGVGEALGEAERRLAAELADDAGDRAGLLLRVHDLEHVLERERLEVEPVGGVVVGRDGLGVAVDHDRLVAGLAQRERGVHAGVVELDALADAVGTAAEDDDRLPPRAAPPRSPRRRTSSGRASWRRTRPRRCRPSCRRGAARGPGGRRARRPRASRGCRRPGRRRSRAAWRGAASRRRAWGPRRPRRRPP